MEGFPMLDKVKEFFGLGGEETYEPEEKNELDVDEQPIKERKTRKNDDNAKNDKIVNINATTQLEVVLVKPEAYADGSIVADQITT